jgi:uridine kinase
MNATHLKRIIKRDGREVPYTRDRITLAIYQATASTGKPDQALAERMALKVEEALLRAYATAVPTVEDIQDIVEATLMAAGLVQVARNYIIYRHQRAMARAARAYAFEATDNIPYKKIYEVLVWNTNHQCLDTEDLNAVIAGGHFADLIAASEKRFADEIAATADLLLRRRDRVRLMIVAGPSSSGKTTTSLELAEHMRRVGIGVKPLAVDHYFFNLEQHPRDEFGDYDYETPRALNLELINRHVRDLLDQRRIRMPHYDFKTGRSTPEAREFELQRGELLLIDSLHGLYDRMTDSVPDNEKFKVYVETLGQFRAADGNFMRWADHRLLRRMLRDKDRRNLQPMETLTHWHYVRRSELQDIIPFIGRADAVVNTALPYELPLLKAKLFHHFPAAIAQFRDAPLRQDAYVRAQRVFDLLAPLTAVSDDRAVPAHSIFREFIGGGRYAV